MEKEIRGCCNDVVALLLKARRAKRTAFAKAAFARNHLSYLWVIEGKCGYDVENFVNVINKKMAVKTYGFASWTFKELWEDFRETFFQKESGLARFFFMLLFILFLTLKRRKEKK